MDSISFDGDFPLPTLPVIEGENVVGILPEELRPLYYVVAILGRDNRETIKRIEVRFKDLKEGEELSEEESLVVDRELLVASQRFCAVNGLFLLEITEAFPLIRGFDNLVSIREGWQVVITDEEEAFANTSKMVLDYFKRLGEPLSP